MAAARDLAGQLPRRFEALAKPERWRDHCLDAYYDAEDIDDRTYCRLDGGRFAAWADVRCRRARVLEAMTAALLLRPRPNTATYAELDLAREAAEKARAAMRRPGLTEAEGFAALHRWQCAQSDYAAKLKAYNARTIASRQRAAAANAERARGTVEIDGELFPLTKPPRTPRRKQ